MISFVFSKKLIVTIPKNNNMSLSLKYLSKNRGDLSFSTEKLKNELRQCPEILFAYILGSAVNGVIKSKSDLDLGIYLENSKTSFGDVYLKICNICEPILPGVRIDVGFLNKCEDPVYKFEVISGSLLFTKNKEIWLRFYSNTAREYEHQMVHYEKQRRYRIQSRLAAE